MNATSNPVKTVAGRADYGKTKRLASVTGINGKDPCAECVSAQGLYLTS